MADTAGPLAVALRMLSVEDRGTLTVTLESALDMFRAVDEYRIPGAALVAAAS